MPQAREIRQGIYWVGSLDPDRRQFDALTPLPDGTSYNSYLVRGQTHTALIDTVEPAHAEVLFGRLASLGVERIDYVISNHAEQDHSGLLPEVLRRFPGARVLATPKAKKMLPDLLELDPAQIDAVEDGTTLDLGGRTLQFLHLPWVHWPETMATWLAEDRILFSCDLFGTHLASHDLSMTDEPRLLQGAKRYYAEIMSPFRTQIQKHLVRVEALGAELIAPSHGPLHVRPALILDAYRRWSSDLPESRVLVAFTSMHGSTKRMADHLTEALLSRGVAVEVVNVEEMDAGKLAMAGFDAATVIIATPMVLGGPHPKAIYAAALLNALRPKLRHAAFIGSYGWGGKLVEPFAHLLDKIKAEVLPPVLAQGMPRMQTLVELDALADAIASRHQALELTRGEVQGATR